MSELQGQAMIRLGSHKKEKGVEIKKKSGRPPFLGNTKKIFFSGRAPFGHCSNEDYNIYISPIFKEGTQMQLRQLQA